MTQVININLYQALKATLVLDAETWYAQYTTGDYLQLKEIAQKKFSK